MKTLEIVMIARKQRAVFRNRLCEMIRIGFPNPADVCRHLYIVAGLPQQGYQEGFSGVVVEV